MRNATGILLTAAGLLAAGNSASAQTQVTLAPAGQAYSIINNVSATAVSPVTYQWYRNNNAIQGATGASYTVSAPLAYGENVQFYRLAKTVDCTGDVEKKSNTVTVTFTGYIMPPGGCNLIIGGVCWADYNINDLYTFASRADMNTKFYQWNRLTAYSTDEPLTPAWNATLDNSETWTVNPCPPNWRLPSQEEYQQLHNSGSVWAAADTRGNIVPGRFYGYNYISCSLPSKMEGCVFFPASGYRSNTDGELLGRIGGGRGWSSTQTGSTGAYALAFDGTASYPLYNNSKAYAFPVRCVR